MKYVAVVVNKEWEAVPCVSAIWQASLSKHAWNIVRLKSISAAEGRPLCKMKIMGKTLVEIWCLGTLLGSAKSSITHEKVPVLEKIAKKRRFDAVIAVGTGAGVSARLPLGSVVCGGSSYVCGSVPGSAKEGRWMHSAFARLLPSSANSDWFDFAGDDCPGFLGYPDLGASPVVVAGGRRVAVSVVNVSNSADYAWADAAALKEFRGGVPNGSADVVETTLGVVRVVFDGVPFVFVSGVLNAVGSMEIDLASRKASKRFVTSFNMGICVGELLGRMAEQWA